jgi:hypothetical protein
MAHTGLCVATSGEFDDLKEIPRSAALAADDHQA